MSVRLALGTLQYLPIKVTDRSRLVTEIDASSAVFTVKRKSDGASMYTDEPAPNTLGMVIYCLIDTEGWQVDDYQIWVRFFNDPERPYLGPITFRVS